MTKLQITRHNHVKGWSLKSENRAAIRDRDKMIHRWHEFYTKLFSRYRDKFKYFGEVDTIPSATI